ncbi:family 1 encapsulin nanocompartment shell protein [Pendulispora albinea]|uniref:Bacteriocin family protein n=1 Tax=Pendulispora albinea TaxID=2741071 RepID=A0ABZ2LU65_9BACT
MNLLKRELAPILPEAWEHIDEEATRVLKLNLAGRKLVDFKGPHGWKFAAVNTGRLEFLKESPVADVAAGVRSVQPLIEIRTPLHLDLLDLDSVARGADDPDLSEVVRASERIARAEDSAIFNGYKAGQIDGIIDTSPHPPIDVRAVESWPQSIVQAKEVLRAAGISGPYAIALGKQAYDELSAGSEDGYPLRKRIERSLIEGPFVWAPAIQGAVLLSIRGGDYELTVGQDLSIGYAYHDKHSVELYITESFTFRVLEPAAAVVLKRV